MKRYSISMLRTVNRLSTPSGLKYQYLGRTDKPQEIIEDYKDHLDWYLGMKITDSQTKQVVFEHRQYNDLSEVPGHADR